MASSGQQPANDAAASDSQHPERGPWSPEAEYAAMQQLMIHPDILAAPFEVNLELLLQMTQLVLSKDLQRGPMLFLRLFIYYERTRNALYPDNELLLGYMDDDEMLSFVELLGLSTRMPGLTHPERQELGCWIINKRLEIAKKTARYMNQCVQRQIVRNEHEQEVMDAIEVELTTGGQRFAGPESVSRFP